MSTPIRFYTDRVITKEHFGLAEGSPEAADAIERVKQQLRSKKGRKPQASAWWTHGLRRRRRIHENESTSQGCPGSAERA